MRKESVDVVFIGSGIGGLAYAVRLASGQVFSAVPGQTILQAAASAHVRMHQSCGVSVCGECKVRLKSGTAEADPCRLLSNKELANGGVLACEAMPTSDVELEPA